MSKDYDFCGYATRNDILCSDGRVIGKNAFLNDDGKTVPLVFNHDHKDLKNVVGHALLENREDGVYTYGYFNDTDNGKIAQKLVSHGDITALSIYANKLKHDGNVVKHGVIKEVSLVLAGANIGAYIENVLTHSDEESDSAQIYTGGEFDYILEDVKHNDSIEENDNMNEEFNPEEFINSLTDDELSSLMNYVVENIEPVEENIEHSEEEIQNEKDITIGNVFETLNETQKNAVLVLIKNIMDEYEDKGDNMKHNLFDNNEERDTLTHSDFNEALNTARSTKVTSLRDAIYSVEGMEDALSHANDYGIKDIDILFPDAKTATTIPEFIKRDTGWVGKFIDGAKHLPFSRVKTVFADVTMEEARARGYVKGKEKVNEQFALLKRQTGPQTIYKHQKLDRDDILDITDFDVVSWLKAEMRFMLNEELARAALIGDGRVAGAEGKINADNIRPIATDDDMYAIKAKVSVLDSDSVETIAKNVIKTSIKARKNYKGSGNPIFFTTEDMLTDMLLLEDSVGRPLYESEEKLRTVLRVKEIVTVPVMEGDPSIVAIIVNPADYAFGADKGGAVNMFDDFDIDFNQQKYLIETRCSGALIKPYSAIVVSKESIS